MRGLIIFMISVMAWLSVPVLAPAAERTAVIIPLHEDINSLSGGILQRKFKEAEQSGVDVIIFDIDSPGGAVDVTFDLMDMVLESKVETVAMIERDAISGAALLSLACDKIIIKPGARLGDAGVIGLFGTQVRYAEAKFRTMVAKKARDTAKATGRPEVLAEKMTDKDMVVFSATNNESGETRYISDKEWETLEDADQWTKGKPIREGQKEAFFIADGLRLVELGMADQTFESRSELGKILNVKTPIDEVLPTWAESIARFLNTGWLTFFLISIGLIALGVELMAPGIGVGGLTSLLCFSLFFWSRFAVGTSGWLEVMLFVLGLVFIACEIFVIPGFGVAGLGGIGLLLGSLVMASRRVLVPENAEQLSSLGYDVLTVTGAFAGFVIALLLLSNYIGEIPGLSRLTLKPPALEGVAASEATDMSNEPMLPGWQRVSEGDVGTTMSPLRPSGKMQVDDFMVDVVTEGDFVDSGQNVRVIGKQGSRVIVRPV